MAAKFSLEHGHSPCSSHCDHSELRGLPSTPALPNSPRAVLTVSGWLSVACQKHRAGVALRLWLQLKFVAVLSESLQCRMPCQFSLVKCRVSPCTACSGWVIGSCVSKAQGWGGWLLYFVTVAGFGFHNHCGHLLTNPVRKMRDFMGLRPSNPRVTLRTFPIYRTKTKYA